MGKTLTTETKVTLGNSCKISVVCVLFIQSIWLVFVESGIHDNFRLGFNTRIRRFYSSRVR